MTLPELIQAKREGRTLSRLAQDTDDVISQGRFSRLLSGPMKSFPEVPTIRALAKALNVPVLDVVIACAESLGLETVNQSTDLTIRNGKRLPQTAQDTILIVAGEFAKVYGLDGRKRHGVIDNG